MLPTRCAHGCYLWLCLSFADCYLWLLMVLLVATFAGCYLFCYAGCYFSWLLFLLVAILLVLFLLVAIFAACYLFFASCYFCWLILWSFAGCYLFCYVRHLLMLPTRCAHGCYLLLSLVAEVLLLETLSSKRSHPWSVVGASQVGRSCSMYACIVCVQLCTYEPDI